MAFFHGALMGITLATIFGFGPAFFLLIQTSISKGFKTALLFDLGVLLSDMLVVILMMLTSIQISLDNSANMVVAGITAGLIIIGFGVFTFYSKPEKIVARSEKKSAQLAEMDKKFEKFDQRLDKIDEKLDSINKAPFVVFLNRGKAFGEGACQFVYAGGDVFAMGVDISPSVILCDEGDSFYKGFCIVVDTGNDFFAFGIDET